MDLSSFITYDRKESLLLSIAKSNQKIVENTPDYSKNYFRLRTNPLNYFHVPFILDHMRSVGITELNNVLMFSFLCGEEKTDPYVKNVSFLIFRLAWNFH